MCELHGVPAQLPAVKTKQWAESYMVSSRTAAKPNPYEDSLCQETHSPSERFLAFFPLSRGEVEAFVGRVLLPCCLSSGPPQMAAPNTA